MVIRPLAADAQRRWFFLAAVAVAAMLGLSSMKVEFDTSLLPHLLVAALGVHALSMLVAWIGARLKIFVLSGTADFFCATSQLTVFLLFSGGLQYAIFSFNFPLVDSALGNIDAWLGFNWHAYSGWVEQRPFVKEVFRFAYDSTSLQMFGLCFIHCLRPERDGNAELVWSLMLSTIIVYIIALPFPALGYPGVIGQSHIDALTAARAGIVSHIDGIITFPSFHTAMGVIFAYSARTIRPLLAVSLPLNCILILATPPFGGHYLADVIAGAIAAALAIVLTHWVMASHSRNGAISLQKIRGFTRPSSVSNVYADGAQAK